MAKIDVRPQANEHVVAQVRVLWGVAFDVALARYTKALRKKGRTLSVRALKMWSEDRSRREAGRAMAEAFRGWDADQLPVEQQITIARVALNTTLRKEMNSRPGPKPAGRPLMQIAREHALSAKTLSSVTGRPRLLPDHDERLWLARFYGLKVRLAMTKGGYTLPMELGDAIKKAKAAVKLRGGFAYLDGDSGVSDRQVLCRMRSDDPSVSLAALRSRLRRARQRHVIQLFG